MAIAEEYQQILNRYKSRKKEYSKLVKSLKTLSGKELDQLFIEADENTFEEVDCLACGNCCRTTSPLFKSGDIEQLAKRFRLKPAVFIDQYLYQDEDGDYVLKQAPCPFLGNDNYCSVYEDRPQACRDYPHTHHRKMHNYLSLAQKNAAICPAVVRVLDRVGEALG